MLVIALDTSTPSVTAGLVALRDGTARTLAERVTVNPRAHGELLTPHLLEVLAESGHRLADVEAVVVGSGPGPFTGLRAGMVTAAALGHAIGRPVHPVCGLDAIACSAPDTGALLVATDARRGEVYWAAYGPDRARLREPEVQRPEELPSLIAELNLESAAGEMAAKHSVLSALHVTGPESPTPEGLVLCAAEELRAARIRDRCLRCTYVGRMPIRLVRVSE